MAPPPSWAQGTSHTCHTLGTGKYKVTYCRLKFSLFHWNNFSCIAERLLDNIAEWLADCLPMARNHLETTLRKHVDRNWWGSLLCYNIWNTLGISKTMLIKNYKAIDMKNRKKGDSISNLLRSYFFFFWCRKIQWYRSVSTSWSQWRLKFSFDLLCKKKKTILSGINLGQ